MEEYRIVDNMFAEFDTHVVASKSLIEHPYKECDDVLIERQIVDTLDDGMEIELCFWTDTEYHLSLCDVSIDKEIFDSKVKKDFCEYIKEKGLYLENLQTAKRKWRFCGIIYREDVYRIQYCEEDE